MLVSGLASGVVDLRFYTAEGELPACGHGTVAALAYLADRAGVTDFEVHLRVGSRILTGRVDGGRAFFEEPRVALRLPTAAELTAVLPVLGLWPLTVGVLAASTGRWRLLIPVASRHKLDGLDPDPFHLRDATERLGLLGCYVYTPPDGTGHAAARMFAPAIGVPERRGQRKQHGLPGGRPARPRADRRHGRRLGPPVDNHGRGPPVRGGRGRRRGLRHRVRPPRLTHAGPSSLHLRSRSLPWVRFWG